MKRNCVICGKRFDAKRYDSDTCGTSACRSKLSRMRRKADKEAQARLLSADDQNMLRWLNKHIPDVETDLRALNAIYGKDAFQLAVRSLKAMALYQQQRS